MLRVPVQSPVLSWVPCSWLRWGTKRGEVDASGAIPNSWHTGWTSWKCWGKRWVTKPPGLRSFEETDIANRSSRLRWVPAVRTASSRSLKSTKGNMAGLEVFFFLFWWTDHLEQDAYAVPCNLINHFNLQSAVQNKLSLCDVHSVAQSLLTWVHCAGLGKEIYCLNFIWGVNKVGRRLGKEHKVLQWLRDCDYTEN